MCQNKRKYIFNNGVEGIYLLENQFLFGFFAVFPEFFSHLFSTISISSFFPQFLLEFNIKT
jgi:hypothetical protein